MRDAHGSELTDADLSDAERAVVERVTRTLEIAMAATPDQIYPLARLLTLAQIADEQASIRADMERLARHRSDRGGLGPPLVTAARPISASATRPRIPAVVAAV